jgi:hypothetical protein
MGTAGTGGAGGSAGTVGSAGGGGTSGLAESLWWKHLSASGYARDARIAIDRHDNLIVTGLSLGDVSFDAPATGTGESPRCLFIAKYAPDGSMLWARQIGGSGSYSAIRGLGIGTNDEIYLSGDFESGPLNFGGLDLLNRGRTDMFVAALDSSGGHLWSLARGNTGWDTGSALAVDSAGNIVTTYMLDNRLSILSLAPSGDVVFERETVATLWVNEVFGTPTAAVTTNASRDIFVTGRSFLTGQDLGAGPVQSSPYEGAFVLSYSGTNGDFRWARAFSTNRGLGATGEGLVASSILADGDSVLAFGSFPGVVDFGGGDRVAGDDAYRYSGYIARFGGDGSHEWSYAMTNAAGSGSSSEIVGATPDPSGDIALTASWNGGDASFQGLSAGGAGRHLVLLSPHTGLATHITPVQEMPTGAADLDAVGRSAPILRDSKLRAAMTFEIYDFGHAVAFPFATITAVNTDTVVVRE